MSLDHCAYGKIQNVMVDENIQFPFFLELYTARKPASYMAEVGRWENSPLVP